MPIGSLLFYIPKTTSNPTTIIDMTYRLKMNTENNARLENNTCFTTDKNALASVTCAMTN